MDYHFYQSSMYVCYDDMDHIYLGQLFIKHYVYLCVCACFWSIVT